jgi:hypothetical protein
VSAASGSTQRLEICAATWSIAGWVGTIHVTCPSFAVYFGPWERGGGSVGQTFVALPEAERIAIREEVRLAVGDKGGPVIIDQKTWFARGIR